MKELVKSEVVYNQELHTYTLDGERLSGITDMIKRHLFPTEYDNVPEMVMENARQRGTLVHEVCEIMDELGVDNDMPEAQVYKSIKEQYGLCHEASEYLVSDNFNFASCIDKVYREGLDEFTLGDIKTTYVLNEEYVRWQLSIYAHLFEMQNPGCKVVRLLAIWLRGDKGKVVELERIPTEEVIRLLVAEVDGEQFIPSLPQLSDSLPQKYAEMEQTIIEIDTQKKHWEQQRKILMEGIMKEMVKAGVYSWKGENITFTRTKESVRLKFDEEAFRNDHEELYNQYIKDVPVASSLRMKTTKKQNNE